MKIAAIIILVIGILCVIAGSILYQIPYWRRKTRTNGIIELVPNSVYMDRYVVYRFNNKRRRVKLPFDPAYNNLKAKNTVIVALDPKHPTDIRLVKYHEKNIPGGVCAIIGLVCGAVSLILAVAIIFVH